MEALIDVQVVELEGDLNALREEVKRLLDQTRPGAEPVDVDEPIGRVSRMDAIQQQQMTEAERRRLEARLRLVQAALTRVGDAAYGYCVRCDEPIGYARLKAQPESPLAGCRVGDARALEFEDASADAALLLGPLYHLTERADRLAALREARRVLRPGGNLFAAGISHFASTVDALVQGYLSDEAFMAIVERDLREALDSDPPFRVDIQQPHAQPRGHRRRRDREAGVGRYGHLLTSALGCQDRERRTQGLTSGRVQPHRTRAEPRRQGVAGSAPRIPTAPGPGERRGPEGVACRRQLPRARQRRVGCHATDRWPARWYAQATAIDACTSPK